MIWVNSTLARRGQVVQQTLQEAPAVQKYDIFFLNCFNYLEEPPQSNPLHRLAPAVEEYVASWPSPTEQEVPDRGL